MLEKQDNWLKIAPPAGCFSVITKTYATVDPATKTATVTGDNVWLRSAGELRSDKFFSLQCRVNKGDKLKFLGEAGEFYKVESPAEAYFWISADFVKPAAGGGAEALAAGGEGGRSR